MTRLSGLRSMVRTEMAPERYDTYLQAFADGSMGVRSWEQKARARDMGPHQITSLRGGVTRLLRTAYEIEAPWPPYVAESVGYFTNGGVQKLATFMRTVWEGDERRHAALFRSAYRGVTETDPESNPHPVGPVLPGDAALEDHLFARLNAEMGASAAYTVLASHTRGDLAVCVANIAGDEFRHLAVFWAGIKWLLGRSAPARVGRWLRQLRISATRHRRLRTGLRRLDWQDAVLLAEIGAVLVCEVRALLSWDRLLTPVLLHSIFGCPPPAEAPQAEQEAAA